MNTLTAAMINCVSAISKLPNAKEELALIIRTYQRELVRVGGEEVPMPEVKLEELDPKHLRKYSIMFGIKTIAEERLKQLRKGHTLESDLKYNTLQTMIDGAIYCLTLDTFWYPKKWRQSTMETILNMSEWDRVKIAGAFLSSYLDITKYKEENEKRDENIHQGLMPQVGEVGGESTYEELTLHDMSNLISEIQYMNQEVARVAGVPSINLTPNSTTATMGNGDSWRTPSSTEYDEEPEEDYDVSARRDSEEEEMAWNESTTDEYEGRRAEEAATEDECSDGTDGPESDGFDV